MALAAVPVLIRNGTVASAKTANGTVASAKTANGTVASAKTANGRWFVRSQPAATPITAGRGRGIFWNSGCGLRRGGGLAAARCWAEFWLLHRVGNGRQATFQGGNPAGKCPVLPFQLGGSIPLGPVITDQPLVVGRILGCFIVPKEATA